MTFQRVNNLISRHKKLVFLLAIVGALVSIPLSIVNADAIITVDSSADNTTAGDGFCTLREAITNANNDSDSTSGDCTAGSGTDTIEFDITSNEGAGPHTISVTTDLPELNDTTTIDGYSETGATVNSAASPLPFNGTIMIQLDGGGTVDRGFWAGTGSDGSTIKGLSITGFAIDGILLEPADDHSVVGNYIGLQPDGSTIDANNNGVSVNNSDDDTIGGTSAADRNIIAGNTNYGIGVGASLNTSNNTIIRGNYIGVGSNGTTDKGNGSDGINISYDGSTIGGTAAGATNLISGNQGDGVRVNGRTGLNIQGNYIGTTYTGNSDLGNNLSGVALHGGGNNTVGGSNASARNVLSGNDDHGVFLASDSDENIISGNYIGVGANGTTAVANTDPAVSINSGSSSNLIGGTTAGEANVIRRNTDNGVAISGSSSTNNAIIGNSLSSNAPPNIDLGNDGSTSNDANDSDTGPNDLLNYPVWGLFDDDSGDTEVTYDLDVPAGNYRVETFSNNGLTLVDTQNITHTGSGSEEFSNTITGNGFSALRMTVTEIDAGEASGFGSTSEYSNTYSDGTSTITVNSTADDEDDDGECTLREAITSANNDAESGTSDGECLAGSGEDTIEFDIAGAGPHTISPSGSDLPPITADNVTINGYSETGAVQNSGDYSACFVGTIVIELDGGSAGAGAIGLDIRSDNVTIRGLAINSFTDDGINISNTADGSVVAGNIIGLNTAGDADEGNTNDGIQLAGSTNTLIGGTSAADRNVISGNNQNGINVSSTDSDVVIQGNCIGTGSSGITDLGNTNDGVSLTSEDMTTIGGTTSGARNIISGNDGDGIEFSNGYGDNSVVRGNYIGLGSNGTTDLGNGNAGINSGAPGLIIGGTVTGSRNVISGNTSYGFSNFGNGTATVQGNYFGYIASGSGVVANGGAQAANASLGSNVQFGGTTTAARNFIASGGVSSGVTVFGGGPFGGSSNGNNIIQGNCIGTNLSCEPEAGFEVAAGVVVGFDALNNVIGGTADGAGNTIAGNYEGVAGFSISGGGYVPLNNSVLGNKIYQNTGGSLFGIITAEGIGIDWFDNPSGNFSTFSEVGVTPNDLGDGDTGTNDYLNFPVLDSSSASAGQLNVQFDLDVDETAPNGYRVEFFANTTGDTSGNGEGQFYLGSHNVAGDVTNEVANITLDPGAITTGSYDITATVTERDNSDDGFGATSEFSAFLDNQSIIQPLDNDDDGVNDAIEDAGPNGGDGNGDGTADSEQESVATILDAEGDDYITLELDSGGNCTQIEDFRSVLESDLADQDPDYIYPLTLTEFVIPCADSVDGTIFWHGEEQFSDQVYRKYGPTTPGDSGTTSWYNSDFTLGATTVGGESVATASFNLTDGGLGDDTGDDDSIVDANGPGLPVSDSVADSVSNLLADTGFNIYLILLTATTLMFGSAMVLKRKNGNN